MKSRLLLLGVMLLVACGDDDTADEPSSPAPPPDAGTQAGHGADTGRVAVPESDASPPAATITLARAAGGRALAEASRGKRCSFCDTR